jgi:hypothetical protein
MKKAKIFLMLTAILIAGVGALATRSKQACLMSPNYYWNGSTYSPAGVMGADFYCASSGNVCTYVLAGGMYFPCSTGTYTPMGAKLQKNAQHRSK